MTKRLFLCLHVQARFFPDKKINKLGKNGLGVKPNVYITSCMLGKKLLVSPSVRFSLTKVKLLLKQATYVGKFWFSFFTFKI